MRLLHTLAIFCMATSFSQATSAEIVAHRGASATAPENTLAAFRQAWAEKSDGVELDILMTKDGRIVVNHDADTKRTTGVKKIIKDHTLAELRKLDAGSWKGDRWKGEPIPTLEEALAALPEGKSVYIEIKCGPEVLPELKRVIGEAKKPEGMRVIAFDFETIAEAKKLMPEVKMLWLVNGEKDPATGKRIYPEIADLAKKAADAGLDGINLHHGFPINKDSVAAIHGKGLAIAVWTVNDSKTAMAMAEAGVDMIATDHPAKLREWLETPGD